MGKPLNLPADLIKDWARKHAAANAKLEGHELPDDFVRSVQVQQFLNMRREGGLTRRPPDPSLGLEAVVNANGEIVTWV